MVSNDVGTVFANLSSVPHISDALYLLRSYSLIARDKMSDGYNIHPLVHLWARERLTIAEK